MRKERAYPTLSMTTRWWQKTEMQVPVTALVFAEQGVVAESIGEYGGISSKVTNDTLANIRFRPGGLETWPGDRRTALGRRECPRCSGCSMM